MGISVGVGWSVLFAEGCGGSSVSTSSVAVAVGLGGFVGSGSGVGVVWGAPLQAASTIPMSRTIVFNIHSLVSFGNKKQVIFNGSLPPSGITVSFSNPRDNVTRSKFPLFGSIVHNTLFS